MYVLNQASLLAQAMLEIGTGGPFKDAKISLYTNDVAPSKTAPLDYFEAEDFGGLTNEKPVVWGAPGLNNNGQAEVLGGLLTWTTTAPLPEPVTAYGYIMTNAAGSVLILSERFAEPVNFVRSGQSESILPRLVWDS